MSQNKLYTAINQVEECITKSFLILGSYSLVYKTELYDKFKLLYESLPQELIANRDELNRQKEENIFTLLNQMSFMLEQSKTFLGFIIVNVNTITDSLDKMYVSLPEDIKICTGNRSILENNTETIEIPDFLKK